MYLLLYLYLPVFFYHILAPKLPFYSLKNQKMKNKNSYAPYKVEEVEYEDPATLMEELISKQQEILKGFIELKNL
jgi:hypothetical protein